MSKRVDRVRIHLDSMEIRSLPMSEIKAILRGADDLIMQGGRTLLANILKGSKTKKVLEKHLDQSPVYGYFNHLTLEAITAKIDWLILNHYLKIEYADRLPLLVYTPVGWEIEIETYTDELLNGFDELLTSGDIDFDMTCLKDRNRGMILLLLDKVAATGNPRYIPILEAWEKIDYQKVRCRIREVITEIKNQSRI